MTTQRIRFARSLIALACISCLLLITPVTASHPLTLTGTVVDSYTHQQPQFDVRIIRGSGVDPYTAIGADGRFSIPALITEPGSYYMIIGGDNYRERQINYTVSQADLDSSQKDLGQIELTRYLSGYVTDSISGQPLSGATVSLVDPSMTPPRVYITGTTDGNGHYALRMLDAGLNQRGLLDKGVGLNLTATRDGYLPASVMFEQYPLDETRLYNFQLTRAFTAGFYAFGHVGQAPYSVRFMDQSVGSPTAWHWDFGDGTTSDEQNPTHTYTQTGVYNVALTASNDQVSDTCTQYRCIIVNTVPVAAFTANTTAGQSPFTVQFTDQSSSTADGYQWDFGDGTTSTEQNPVHTYTNPGSYTVMLTVSVPDYGSVFTQKAGYISVSGPSSVGFSVNVTAGLAPLAVQFTESVNGTVQYSFWHFGDGATSTEQNPVHVYDTPGNYSVSLMTVGPNGTEVKTVDNYISVSTPITPTVTPTVTVTPTPTGALPVANFTVTPGAPGSSDITVTDTSVNATSVSYDLGDGTTTAYPNFRYTYWQPGTYTIEQTATNAVGSSVKTIEVTVPAVTPTTTIPPLGGDKGSYTIHCNVDGATVIFDQTAMGTVASGILKVSVYTTATPYRTYTVQKDGYSTVFGVITDHPGKGQNVDITVTLNQTGTPYNGPHTIPGTLQAEDYNLGGEGVAYHDTTPGNEGGIYRHDDVDIEQLDTDGSPNVGWIRAGEWMAYTVNVSTAGTYNAGFRVASSHSGSSVQVYLDDGTTPVATVNVPNTGDWMTFQTISVPVTLPAGQHRLVLKFPADYANINWISFT